MSEYGIQPTGYAQKPISVILAELEAAMITEFGAGVIQSPQSPFGQLNGLMADLISEIDERNLDLYQSYDPDQAEGTRLETLAKIRLISRGEESYSQLRKSITNEGQSRVDVQDLSRAVKSIDGVTFAQVFINETGEVTIPELDKGTIAVAVIGGDDEEVALTIRKYAVPGIDTYGNTRVIANVDGYCRSVSIIRPIDVPVELEITMRVAKDKFGCSPPSLAEIRNLVAIYWEQERINGLDPSFYTIRTIIEREFTNIEVISVQGSRDGETFNINEPVPIGFIEIASIASENISANYDG